MRAIITGAAGFIGSHVAELLARDGHAVLAIDDLSGGRLENVPAGVAFLQADVRMPLVEIFRRFRPDVVYHLAAYAAEGLSHHIPTFNYLNNVAGTTNVLTAAHLAGARHFVFTSSIAVYGPAINDRPFHEDDACHPCDPYGVAKLACEQHLRAFCQYYGRPNFTILRPHNVFGPRQNIADPFRNVVGIFFRAAMTGQPLPIFGTGNQTRSFSYIASVARCIADAPQVTRAQNATFNVGGDHPLSVNELARLVAQTFDVPLRIQGFPPRREVLHAHCDHRLAREVFDYAFEHEIDVREGLRRMADDVCSRPIPRQTPCPAPLEISDQLPPSWERILWQTDGEFSTPQRSLPVPAFSELGESLPLSPARSE
jgi:UDP-glucose 4-epimerase